MKAIRIENATENSNRVAPGDHHQEPEQDDGEREGEVLARQRVNPAGDRKHQHDRQRDEAEADQHHRAAADHLLDLAVNLEPAHDAVQRHGDDPALDHEGDRGGDEEMRGVLQLGLPGDREAQHDRLRGEHVQRRGDAILIEQQKAQDHHAGGEQMGDVGEQRHQNPRDTNWRNTASAAAAKAPPKNTG